MAGELAPGQLAAEIDAAIRAMPAGDTPATREVRRSYSQRLKHADPAYVLAVARELLRGFGQRWVAYELVARHKEAFKGVGETELEEFGRGMKSWGAVDAFARTLAGPAWLRRQVDDDLIERWGRSDNLWWRRAALVSTVALNMRSQGGTGDVPRTLAICGLLAGDREDMVIKALSWALRELAPHDPDAVRAFLAENDSKLAARVTREVQHKLKTGLKAPRRRKR